MTHDNPRIISTSGYRHGAPTACAGCAERIDTAEEYHLLCAGAARRPELLGIAHPARYVGPDEEDWDSSCEEVLIELWRAYLADAGGGQLAYRPSRQRCVLLGEELHCGRPVEVLSGDGVWIAGRYETALSPDGLQPWFYFDLAGSHPITVGLRIPAGAALRPIDF